MIEEGFELLRGSAEGRELREGTASWLLKAGEVITAEDAGGDVLVGRPRMLDTKGPKRGDLGFGVVRTMRI